MSSARVHSTDTGAPARREQHERHRHDRRSGNADRGWLGGHRAGRLSGADLTILRERVGEVLDAFHSALTALHTQSEHDYSAATPSMTVVSSLASGSDSLVASEALARGFALHSPLPFARDEYRIDSA